MDNRRHAVVPMNFRTDGHWVWADAVAYYLRTYGLAPGADLLEHIRARQYEGRRRADVYEVDSSGGSNHGV
jgi:hypothetical protein